MAKVLIGNFKGPKGDQGVKGDPGTAATIQVGTTQTVQPEANAEVMNTGTTTAAVLNFKIPRGEDGMTDLTAEYKDDSSYTCQPTVNAPIVINDLNGKTQQTQTNGYQLFDASKLPSKTQGGATVTNNGDGSFTISGSGNASENVVMRTENLADYFKSALKPGKLKINTSITSPVFYVNIYYQENGERVLKQLKPNGTLEIDLIDENISAITTVNIGFTCAINASINPGTIRPMLYQSGDGTWEPYTGGSPAPSPDYPQAIKGVGGMGHFDGEWVQGNISSTGAIGTETTGITSANAIPCKQNDNIAVTYEDSIDVIAVAFYNASGAYISTSTSGNSVDTFTATAPANAASFKVNLRVVSGSTITPNGAKYCTVTINGEYQTGVETTGAQLLDYKKIQQESYFCTVEFIENGVKLDGVWYAALNSISVIPDTDYCISYVGSGTKKVSIFARGDGGRLNPIITMSSSNPLVFNTSENNNIDILFYASASETPGTATYTNIMLNAGSTALPYQPYHHTALTIPLTSPLYEGDKICYVKPGESYVNAEGETVVADGILYGVYRENAEVVFDGSEDENWKEFSSEANPNGKVYLITDFINGKDKHVSCISNRFKSYDAEWAGLPLNCSQNKDNAWGCCVESSIADVSSFKTWLQSHNVTVVVKLSQPYFEPFVDQSIFYSLRTDDTLSYVYSGDPIEPVLTVEVAKNSTGGYLLESYAQAQKNAISEANSQSRLSAIEQQLVNQATAPTE